MAEIPLEDVRPEPERQSILALEVLVVLLFSYAGSFFSQFMTVLARSGGPLDPWTYLAGSLGRTAPVLFIVWVRDGSLANVGFKKPVWKWDVPLTALLTAAMLYFSFFSRQFSHVYWPFPHHTPTIDRTLNSGNDLLLLFPGILLSAAYQEILMRGYLIGRLRELMGNAWMPVLLSAVLFSLWHIYEGPSGPIATLFDGLLFGMVFACTGRLWPMIVAHFLTNAWYAYNYNYYLQHIWTWH